MEAFKVFATMSLVDMISGPLGKIGKSMSLMGDKVDKLSNRMGKFALSMAPLALASAVVLSSFWGLAQEAIAFESVMADVAKVVEFETTAELQAMSDTILEMSTRIPMAADGLGAIISAAAQSGVAKDDLAEFAEQAAKMGVAFDMTGDIAGQTMADWRAGMNLSLPRVYALADAVNHLSNNMNATAPALSEVIQRVGPLAMTAGLAETQVAALGAAFLAAGASPEIASTALRKFTSTLVLGSAMADRQAEAFRGLGFDTVQMAKDMQTDAQGTIMSVLQALADKPKELQVSLLTQMFGEQGLGAIAPLLSNMDNLTQAFDLVADSAAYAGSMQAEFNARAATTENALILLRNKFTALTITMGNAFLPAIKVGAEFLGIIIDLIRRIMASPIGQWVLRLTAALAGAIVAVTAFAGGFWVLNQVGPLAAKALTPVKTILLSLSWPVYAVIAAFAAFYLAYRTNFGGFADFVDGVFSRVRLVFQGVREVVSSMVDGVGEIRGELAQEIQAQGLLGIVTNISRVFYRVQRLFLGFWNTLSGYFDNIAAVFGNVFDALGAAVEKLGQLFAPVLARLAPGEVNSAASAWENFGAVLGHMAGFVLEGLATSLQVIVDGITVLVEALRLVIAIFTGDWATAGEAFRGILNSIGDAIMAVADLFGFGDWMRESWEKAANFLATFSLYEAGVAILTGLLDGIKSTFHSILDWLGTLWGNITGFFQGVSLFEAGTWLMDSLINGIMSLLGAILELPAKLFYGFIDGVKSFIGGFFGAGSELGDSLTQGVDSMSNSLLEKGAGLVNGLVNAITGLVGDVFNAGVSLASGLGDGLQSMSSSVSNWCSGVWDSITGFFSGQSLAESGRAIMETLGAGVTAAKDSLVGAVSGVFSRVRDLLPFSDAKEGPFSDLTASGRAIMTTLGEGIMAAKDSLINNVSSVFSHIRNLLPFSDAKEGPLSELTASGSAIMTTLGQGVVSGERSLVSAVTGAFAAVGDVVGSTITGPGLALGQAGIPAPDLPDAPGGFARGENGGRTGINSRGGGTNIHIERIDLPSVTDAQGFVAALQNLVAEYDGVPA